MEFIENPNENEYSVRMTTEGVYYFAVEAIDDQSNIFTDTVAIEALDEFTLDTLLRAKWERMRQALITNDIESAVAEFRLDRRAAYNEVFTALSDQIASILPGSQNIELVEVLDIKVQYIADIEIVVDNQPMTVSSYIIFIKDEDGLWRINF